MIRTLLCATILLASAGAASAQEHLSDVDLDQERGGFLTVDGVLVGFAGVIRTFDEAGLALETRIDWTAAGPVIKQTGKSESGGADFVHQVSDGDLRNLIMNRDSGRSLRQEVDVTLTLPGFTAVQGDISRGLLGLQIGDDIAAAVRASGP